MSVEVLKQELASLAADQLREIVRFLVGLNRTQRQAADQVELAARLDDPSPGAWVTLEEADARLDWLPDGR